MTDRLTVAGWPRPIVDGWPVPWVSPSNALAIMDDARAAACASGAICAVCGGGFGEGETAYAIVRQEGVAPDLATVDVQPMDNGVLHRRCLLLAAAKCPALLRLQSEGFLVFVRVPSNAATVVIADGGKPKARFDGADCEIIDLEEVKNQ